MSLSTGHRATRPLAGQVIERNLLLAPSLRVQGRLADAYLRIIHGRCLRSTEGIHLDTPALREALGLWGVREGSVQVQRRQGATQILRRPCVFVTEPGTVIDLAPRSVVYLLHFDFYSPKALPPQAGFTELFGSPMPMVAPSERVEELLAQLEEMLLRWWRSDVDRLYAQGMLAQVLAGLHAAEAAPSSLAQRYQALVAERAAYGASVQWLVKRLGVSASTLGAACRREYGQSPAQLLDAHRMALAIQYLNKHPDAPIEHVAACVGYRDHSAFGRRFRRVYGCSPSAWRQRQN